MAGSSFVIYFIVFNRNNTEKLVEIFKSLTVFGWRHSQRLNYAILSKSLCNLYNNELEACLRARSIRVNVFGCSCRVGRLVWLFCTGHLIARIHRHSIEIIKDHSSLYFMDTQMVCGMRIYLVAFRTEAVKGRLISNTTHSVIRRCSRCFSASSFSMDIFHFHSFCRKIQKSIWGGDRPCQMLVCSYAAGGFG